MDKFAYLMTVLLVGFCAVYIIWDNPVMIIRDGRIEEVFYEQVERNKLGRHSSFTNYFKTVDGKSVQNVIAYKRSSLPDYEEGKKYLAYCYEKRCLILDLYNVQIYAILFLGILFVSLFVSALIYELLVFIFPEKKKKRKYHYPEKYMLLKREAYFPGGVWGCIAGIYLACLILFIVGIPYYQKWLYIVNGTSSQYHGILYFGESKGSLFFHVLISVILLFNLLCVVGIIRKLISMLYFTIYKCYLFLAENNNKRSDSAGQ